MLNSRGNVRLTALFSRMQAPDRDWELDPRSWEFEYSILPVKSRQRVPAVLRHLHAHKPDVFISEYDRADFCAGLVLASPLVGRTAARVLPTFPAWSNPSPVREIAKHVVFRSLSAATVSGPEAAQLAARFGLPQRRTFRITQSIDVEHYAKAKLVSAQDRERERSRLGLNGVVFAYVGRLWTGKGVDTLLAAYRALPDRHGSSLLLVGSGVDEARFRAAASDLPGVVFAGFRDLDKMPNIYALADALVLPTLGDPHGLVVEEAMAAGLPVISSSAAGHITERIAEDETGYIVPPNDVEALRDAMDRIARDPEHAADMGALAAERVSNLGHHRWAEDFERFVAGSLELPARLDVRAWRAGK